MMANGSGFTVCDADRQKHDVAANGMRVTYAGSLELLDASGKVILAYSPGEWLWCWRKEG
jgi:hypothetical protein